MFQGSGLQDPGTILIPRGPPLCSTIYNSTTSSLARQYSRDWSYGAS